MNIRNMRLFTLIFTATLLVLPPGFSTTKEHTVDAEEQTNKEVTHSDSIHFHSPTLDIEFASPEEGMGLRSLTNAFTGEEFLAENRAMDDPLIWKVELTTDISDKESFFTIDNTTPANRRSYTEEDGKLTLKWEGVNVPDEEGKIDVTAEIDVADFHDMTDWRIHVDYNNEDAKLWRVIFPVVDFGEIGESGEDDYFLNSATDGRSVRNPIGEEILEDVVNIDGPVKIRGERDYGIGTERPYGLPYPTGRMQMQLNAYYEQKDSYYYPDQDPGTALYMATHDSEGYPKAYFATAFPADDYFQFEIAHYPDTPHKTTGVYEQPYPFMIGGYEGGWFEAAEYYREWALEQPWASKGPLIDRDDVPDWLLNMNSVFRADVKKGTNDRVPSLAQPYRDQFAGPMMVQWYNWSATEKNPDYQSYAFPPDSEGPEGFKGLVDELQSQDMMVFPYLNMRLWKESDSRFSEYEPHLRLRPSGERYQIGEGDNTSSEISVFSKKYNDYLAQTAKEVVEKYNVKGLYLDQGGNTRFGGNWELSGSFNPNLPEHPGVSKEMVHAEHDRFQAIVDSAHEIDPEVVLTGESVSEYFIDTFASRLTHYEIWPGYVPLFNAVYHDYTTSYGRTASSGPKNSEDPKSAMQTGWLLSSGNQIGRLWPLSSGSDSKNLDYMERVIALKDQFPEYLNYGQLLKPPSTSSKIPYIVTEEFSNLENNSHLPVLLASNWKAEDGSALLVVTNVGQENYSADFSVTYEDLGMKLRPTEVEKVYPNLADPQHLTMTEEDLTLHVDLEPMEVVAFHIDPISSTVQQTIDVLQEAEEIIGHDHWKDQIELLVTALEEMDSDDVRLEEMIAKAGEIHKDIADLETWVNQLNEEILEGKKEALLSVLAEATDHVLRLIKLALPADFQINPNTLINDHNAEATIQLPNISGELLQDVNVTIHFPESWDLAPITKEVGVLEQEEIRDVIESFTVPSDISKKSYPIRVETNFTYDHIDLTISQTKEYRVAPPLEGKTDPSSIRAYSPGVYPFSVQLTNNMDEPMDVQLNQLDQKGININISDQIELAALEEKTIEGEIKILPTLPKGEYEVVVQPKVDDQILSDITMDVHFDRNIVYNPGFEEASTSEEDWPEGWNLLHGGEWDDQVPHNGTYSVRLDPDKDNNHNVIENNVKRMPVKQGQEYLFKAWAKNASTTGNVHVGIRQIDASGKTVTYRWLKVKNDSDWNQYELLFTPHPNAETISVYFKMKHATEVENNGSAWLDDVELSEVTVQSSTDIKDEIEEFEASGEFENERVIRALQIHLTAIERFEKQEEVEKVVKHMKGFIQLLDHQKENQMISDKAYDALKEDAQLVVELWE